ncbi:AsmA family protein, partial [Methylobacterium trifolii]
MSPRRLILALGLGTLTLAGIGGALRPWSVETGRAAAFVGGALEPYGLALTADGPAEVTLLPSPHLSFTRTRL